MLLLYLFFGGVYMKCPYVVNCIVQTKTEINYDAESKEDGSVVTTINKAEFTDCLLDKCGAYNCSTGRCEYKA